MKLALRILAALVVLLALAAAFVLGPYWARVRRFPADPSSGFHAPFFLYVPSSAAAGGTATILVQPNNSGTASDDPDVHVDDAWWMGFERHRLAGELGVVLLVPAFVRPGADWRIYTHALDRDVLTTGRADVARLDLQLLAMVERARSTLAAEGLPTEERFLLQGFSASGMFANRFAALHPTRVKAVAAGSPGGWPIAPVAELGGRALGYPAGVADLEALTGAAFDRAAWCALPQLLVLGSLDDNDSLDFRDGWDEGDAALVERSFGATPVERWDDAERLYREAGADARFLLVEGVGHDRRALQSHTTEFFRAVLAGSGRR